MCSFILTQNWTQTSIKLFLFKSCGVFWFFFALLNFLVKYQHQLISLDPQMSVIRAKAILIFKQIITRISKGCTLHTDGFRLVFLGYDSCINLNIYQVNFYSCFVSYMFSLLHTINQTWPL